MPATSPALTSNTTDALAAVGAQLRQRRKALRISAVAAAEAAGLSRVTLHRIERGEASVTMGAYMAVLGALGMSVRVASTEQPFAEALPPRSGWIPARVRIADYPTLKSLAWQVQGTQELTPREALDIYERNWRHVDPGALSAEERDLVAGLRLALGSQRGV
jgi:transcriptional regulator with XRE-family HTH domain